MKDNCQGPCLPYCCKNEKLIFLLIGVILGAIIYAMVLRMLRPPPEGETRKDLFPKAS